MGMDLGTGPVKKGRHTPEMNVTPLVDVVLVLLIIFMVITPSLSKQLWLNIPNDPDDELPADAINPDIPLVVSVTGEGEMRINRDVVPDGQFPDRLRRVLAARGDRKIFFDAHDDVRFERAAEALDLAKSGGAATVAVMTEALPN